MTAPHQPAKRPAHPALALAGDLLAIVAVPLVEWIDDLTRWERIHRLIGALIAVAIAVALLSSCGPEATPPGFHHIAHATHTATLEIQ